MADGRDDRYATPPGRGRKLRHQGSNPTGSQKMSFTPKYSGDLDSIGTGPLIKKDRLSEDDEYYPTSSKDECCQDLGLNMKEPLS